MRPFNKIKERKEFKKRIEESIEKERLLFEEKCKTASNVSWMKKHEYEKTMNGKCPNCGMTTNLGHRMRNVNGEIDGEIGGNLFYVSGYVHGEVKTNKVNKCNNCGEEWEIVKGNRYSEDEMISKFTSNVRRALEGMNTDKNEIQILLVLHAETIQKLLEEERFFSIEQLESLGFRSFKKEKLAKV